MNKSTQWDVYKSISEDEEELIKSFGSRAEAESYAGDLAEEYDGDHFLVYGNRALSPCWMSW